MEMETYASLNNGHRIPLVALGTSRIPEEKTEACIKLALEMSYRHIDTAFHYGNEVAIGKSLKEYLESTGVKREDVFITTKLDAMFMEEDTVVPAIDESLRRLNLEYVDLFLIHGPCAMKTLDYFPEKAPLTTEYMPIDLRETWKGMEETVYKGKARSIGVSNFNSKQLEYICETARIRPAVNQVEVHARFPQKKLHDFCKSKNIQLEAYSPLGSPYFKGPDALNRVKASDNLVDHPVIVSIAEKYNRTAGQVLLRNLVQRGIVVTPKSENPKRLKENIEIFSFSLDEEDMKKIDGLDNGIRRFCLSYYDGHPDHPFEQL
ncbi:aldo-keto reductase family 1 member C23-like protein [Pecten maximus]|uniref:aldo-keto reductase family 1 member C23-like protein n=1 Tax=Pecten maximus TaxID=6579 RepID=UPI0014585D91|nr:aldo-keto reductase family 1 member C23-like protein [Pecten maximus]XP_033743793.1 aldo-keto reductase family 1 member C23-like protein [Pecten maximus]